MKILLIWDIDGTLIQGKGIGKKALNKAFKDLFNIDNSFDNIDFRGGIDSVIITNVFSNHKIHIKHYDNFINKYFYYLSESISDYKLSLAAPGIVKLFENTTELKSIYNILGTGNFELGARIKLTRDNLNRYFKIGGFGDKKIERHIILKQAIDKAKDYYDINFHNNSIYVIGDTDKDIECAKLLEVKSLAVATGTMSSYDLTNYNPDFLLENLLDYKNFINIIQEKH